MSLSAAWTSGYKLDLAAAVFHVFPKIFFFPEIGEKLYAAGQRRARGIGNYPAPWAAAFPNI